MGKNRHFDVKRRGILLPCKVCGRTTRHKLIGADKDDKLRCFICEICGEEELINRWS